MHARSFQRVALAVASSIGFASVGVAGGGGHGAGGSVFHPGGGFHGGFHGGWGGQGAMGGRRGMPPIAGVIHERPGLRPYFSSYGHTDTAARFARGGVPAYGHVATAIPSAGGFRASGTGYGHVGTAPRYGAERRGGAFGEGRRRFAGGGFGGYGYGYGGGTYGAPGVYGDAGVYGGEGTYGAQGTYGQPGTYGGLGTTATQSTYGAGYGAAYWSETPLAARFAEAPLGPSPSAPYSPGDRYAYAASEDVGPGPRVVNPFRAARSDCACGARSQPVVYRYGIGTAY